MAEERRIIIPEIARLMGAKAYLEIGCRYDEVFKPVREIVPFSEGIDPRSGGTLRTTSDEYFRACNKDYDLIFIDGDHLYEQVARDVANSTRFLTTRGTILLHDAWPPDENHTAPTLCGTVWKACYWLLDYAAWELRILSLDYGIAALRRVTNGRCGISLLEIPPDNFSWPEYLKTRDDIFDVTTDVREFIDFAAGAL